VSTRIGKSSLAAWSPSRRCGAGSMYRTDAAKLTKNGSGRLPGAGIFFAYFFKMVQQVVPCLSPTNKADSSPEAAVAADIHRDNSRDDKE
jgi:hypothetical protein